MARCRGRCSCDLALAVFNLRGQPGATVQPTIVAVGHAQVGHSAPDFTTPTLSGGTLRLSSLRGKVVLINFWATWSPPARTKCRPSSRSGIATVAEGWR